MDLTGKNPVVTDCYLLLGSNVGDSMAIMQEAVQKIAERIGVVKGRSSFYKTEPWHMKSENWFYNQVVVTATYLKPVSVLEACLEIEKEAGRERQEHEGYADRSLDMDILFYGSSVVEEKHLHIPHPRLHERNFTLAPLAEIAPGLVHPRFRKTIKELLAESTDQTRVEKCA